jgi:hypothetical protein
MAQRQHRTRSFTWHSRRELCDYFRDMYNLDAERVQREIEAVRTTFKLRKHQPINPQELWEKAGRALEQKLAPTIRGDETGELPGAASEQDERAGDQNSGH